METPTRIERNDGGKPFVNVKLDYGFKWFFGQLKRKSVLIRYLNAIFERAGRDIVVKDIEYHDKEMLPETQEGKKIIYDIYCSSPEGHHFIVEMQNVDSPLFVNRIVFYTSRIISGQGTTGWNYDVAPVFSVIVSDFNVRNLPKRLFHDVVLYDRETATEFSDRVNIFLICLPELPGSWKECETEFERLSYLVDRIGSLDRDSEEFKDMGYKDFFKAAEKTNMSDSEYVLYSQSEAKDAEIRSGMEMMREELKEQYRQQYLDEGRAEGEVKGRLSLAKEVIRNLLAKKMDFASISDICGLDVSQVREIASTISQ